MPVTKSDFGKILRQLRTSKDWSLQDLATKLSVSKTSIDDYEKGVNYPKVEKLIHLSVIFSVTTDYLLGKSDNVTFDMSGLNNSQKEHLLDIMDKTKEEFIKANKK